MSFLKFQENEISIKISKNIEDIHIFKKNAIFQLN